jgi:hypothetical protein
MQDNDSADEKRIVEQLSFGAKTAKRVGWEQFEFTVVGPYRVKVTNASYGFQKADHAYEVTVAERDGAAVPDRCGCPADRYNEDYDCKHQVCLATIGGPTVLEAAVNFEDPAPETPADDPETMADRLRTDGGDSECDCEGLPGDFPCWPCFRAGHDTKPNHAGARDD